MLGDRLDHLGREAHDAQRGRTDLRVGRTELVHLDLDQRRVGIRGAAVHRGVVATRRAPEHERGTEIVQQARAERVVGLNAHAARDGGGCGSGRHGVLPEGVGNRATLLREQVEGGCGRDRTNGREPEHRHGAPRARHLARQTVERGVRQADDLRRQCRIRLDEPAEIGRGGARVLEHPQQAHRGARLHRQLGDLGDQIVGFSRHLSPRPAPMAGLSFIGRKFRALSEN